MYTRARVRDGEGESVLSGFQIMEIARESWESGGRFFEIFQSYLADIRWIAQTHHSLVSLPREERSKEKGRKKEDDTQINSRTITHTFRAGAVQPRLFVQFHAERQIFITARYFSSPKLQNVWSIFLSNEMINHRETIQFIATRESVA